jgi:hypothetical protein
MHRIHFFTGLVALIVGGLPIYETITRNALFSISIPPIVYPYILVIAGILLMIYGIGK